MDHKQSRITTLRERVAAAEKSRDRTTFPVPFRQAQKNEVIISIPADFPLYNVRSGRTHRAQSQYIDRNDCREDFFADPEDPDVQKAQHAILLELVNLEGLAVDLQRKKQRNPLVLTYDGYVIDGNRRLASIRRDRESEYVTAVVLPEDAEAAEVYETELELQMSRETKAAYNWIDQALHIRLGVNELYARKGESERLHAVAQRMNLDDDAVKGILDRLALVDLYLEWLGKPGKYHEIPTGETGSMEQAFKELAQRTLARDVRRLPQQEQQAIRTAGFAIISQQGGYLDVRRVIDAMRNQSTELVRRVKDQLPEDLKRKSADAPVVASPQDKQTAARSSVFAELAVAEAPARPSPTIELLHVTREPEVAKQSANIIMNIAEELDQEKKEAQRQVEPAQQTDRAAKLLRGISITAQTRSMDEIAAHLDEVLSEAERLMRELDAARGSRD